MLYIIGAIMLIGIFLRAFQLFSFRSLWLDEAMLARNIIDRSLIDLVLTPLDYNQGAPILFLIVEKLATIVFGRNDIALRLIPFISGIVLLPLVVFFTQKTFGQVAGVVAGLLIATNISLIYYASEVKQYSTDALICFGLFAYLYAFYKNRETNTPFVQLFLVGVMAAISSHPALFVLAGCGLVLWLSFFRQYYSAGNMAKITQLSLVLIGWAIVYLLLYVFILRQLSANHHLVNYWSAGFVPFPPWRDFRWVNDFTAELIFPIGYTPPLHWIGMGFMALGVAVACRDKDRFLCTSTFVMLIFILVAAMAQVYPLQGRMLTYTIPFVICYLSAGVQWLYCQMKRFKKLSWLVLLLTGFILVYPSLLNVGYLLKNPDIRYKEHIYPLIEILRENQQQEQPLYVYYGAVHAYAYYQTIDDHPDDPLVFFGADYRGSPEKYLAEISALRAFHQPIWLLFSRVVIIDGVQEEQFILDSLSTKGRLLNTYTERGASLYLFEFDP
jgi:hypothetical protein